MVLMNYWPPQIVVQVACMAKSQALKVETKDGGFQIERLAAQWGTRYIQKELFWLRTFQADETRCLLCLN